ncbi:hypothetical protein [Arthrobacter sp. FW306-04-A]|uniref:hypothetical protein n=1 Tax=Arthrobacter sp. FW306-04-A TaxID=2879619 RepID=UPI0037C08845|nr:hypothetical protein LFT43_01515 [Arthrobacter sp. FW306-04-A]
MSDLTVTGAGLTAVISPTRGGRIESLRSPGREWLAPSFGPDTGGFGRAFVRPGMGGWDEAIPSVSASSMDGINVPDHGDVWSVPWQVEHSNERTLKLGVALRTVPLRLTRTISAVATGLHFEYVLESRATGHTPFLWSAHPQFAALPGTRVELPRRADDAADLHEEYPHRGCRRGFPLGAMDSWLPKGEAFKAFLPPEESVESARLVDGDGRSLDLAWSATEIPHLGILWDNTCFASEPVIAIEPTTGFGDALTNAAACGRVATIAPGQRQLWSLEVSAR